MLIALLFKLKKISSFEKGEKARADHEIVLRGKLKIIKNLRNSKKIKEN